jgi:hypothetical protein
LLRPSLRGHEVPEAISRRARNRLRNLKKGIASRTSFARNDNKRNRRKIKQLCQINPKFWGMSSLT